ncbi:MAG TPA: radical SAM protein [Candidatus Acidoferrum sp.]|nr:radical SAM protein [Candidatus Acidoferrum sp.]
MRLMEELKSKALSLGVPLSAHLDVTYRCNERCDHCYLDHDDKGELTTPEIFALLEQMAEAGVLFLTLSGGEPLVRRDIFDIIARARELTFNVKLKTNAVMIREEQAKRLKALGVDGIQISVYSHRSEVHDAITRLPGSLKRTLAAIRFLRSQGLKVMIANVLMRDNLQDGVEVQRLAGELDAKYTLDPTITPMMNGDTSVLRLRIDSLDLAQVFRTPELVGNVEEFCAPPEPADEDAMDSFPCGAGHTSCYISPYGEVYPCVQFPLPCGNVRREKFIDIWKNSAEMNEVRSIRLRDLPTCSTCAHGGTCTRCPGLAYMEGNMRGPSSADCERSFVRTGIMTAGMRAKQTRAMPGLVQIVAAPVMSASGAV